MAGRARTQALADELESRTREYFDIDPVEVAVGTQTVPSHLEYVCAAVESGTTTKQLCREMSETLGYELTYERLTRYLRDRWNDAPQALDEARVRASHCMAEQALELVDAPAYDSVSVQQARNRANQRNWLAERYNPRAFGQSKGVNVSISVTQLHLQALQAIPNTVTGPPIDANAGLVRVEAPQQQAIDSTSVTQ